ncbi:MAG TPA: hypothetical protein VND65_12035 [Candidatus Binatia bacterium]|nr:hypothetical protein [Candidatus Binatia bacterium]
MSRVWFNFFLLITAGVLLLSSSCGFNQHLTSIQIQPTGGATFGAVDPGLYVDFKAYGTYDHPPQTKDITALVTWESDTPQVASVTSGGVVSPNTNCGTSNVFATFYDSPNQVVSNSALITVDGPSSQGCPQSNALSTLSVTITGGTGTISSSPAGITCGSVCAAGFTTGSTVTLTAAPLSPSTAVTWGNCDSAQGTVCTVFLEANRTVTATFN